MCGRFALSLTPQEAAAIFGTAESTPNFGPDWNIAPTKSAPVVRVNPDSGVQQIDMLSWGLLSHFVKATPKGRPAPFNARAETVRTLGIFKGAYRSRRAIVPANAFYEWKKDGKLKQPMAIARADGKPLAFAGLWECWTDPTNGEIKRTFAIITTAANDFMTPIHDRMPVILKESDYEAWLDTDNEDAAALLRPAAEDILTTWPVAVLVNNVRNNGAELLVPTQSESPTGGANPA